MNLFRRLVSRSFARDTATDPTIVLGVAAGSTEISKAAPIVAAVARDAQHGDFTVAQTHDGNDALGVLSLGQSSASHEKADSTSPASHFHSSAGHAPLPEKHTPVDLSGHDPFGTAESLIGNHAGALTEARPVSGNAFSIDAGQSSGNLTSFIQAGHESMAVHPVAAAEPIQHQVAAEGSSGTAVDPELWITGTTGVDENVIIHADDTGSGSASNTGTLITPDSSNQPVATNLSGLDLLELDTQNDTFVVSSMDSGDPSDIYVVSLSNALANPTNSPTFTRVFEDTSNGGSGFVISGLQLDPDHNEIYFVDHDSFEKVNYSGTGLTTLASTTADGVLPLDGLALDLNHSVAYFATDETSTTSVLVGGVTEFVSVLGSNALYKTSALSNSSSSVTISKLVDVPTVDGVVANGTGVEGIAVDTSTGLIYFTTQKASYIDGSNNLQTTNSGVYVYNPTGATVNGVLANSFKTVWLQGSGGGPTGTLESIQVDDATGKYYVTVHGTGTNDGVYVGSLTANGTTAPTLFLQMPGYSHGAGQPATDGFSIDNAPTFSSVTGTSTEAVQGGPSVTLLVSDGTFADTDNDMGDGAIVTITNGQTGDLLQFGGATSGTLDGGKVSFSYNSTTHVMTLHGTDSFAEYQTLLNQVQFQDTGTDNSTGSHPTRSITFQTYDGLLSSAVSGATTTTLTIDRAPTLTADSYTAQESGTATGTSGTGGTGVLGNDTDKDGDTITVTALNGSAANLGSATFTGTYGHFDLASNGGFTYTADLTGNIDAAALGSHPVDSFTYAVSDGLGGVTASTVSFTLNRAPTLTADNYSVVESATDTVAVASGVLSNDTDHDGDGLTVTQVNGSAANLNSGTFQGTYGHFNLAGNGSFTYTADNTAAIDSAAIGSHPADTFTYTVSDGHGGTTVQT
ncbi:MAG TPA: Ig-like domain-containing protein, partial [Rhizomicrobium sp.]